MGRRSPGRALLGRTALCAAVALAGCSAPAAGSGTPSQPGSRGTPTASHTTAETPAQLYARVKDGVLRVQTVTCDEAPVGSGFLIAPDLVATVAHVVEGAENVSVRGPDGVTKADVVGIEPNLDIALLRTRHALPGHVFTLADTPVEVGDPILVPGYPWGEPLTLHMGAVTSVDRQLEVEGKVIEGTFMHDANAIGGNSGSPVLKPTGDVVGLHDAGIEEVAGIRYAIPTPLVASLLEGWRPAKPIETETCDRSSLVTFNSQHAEAPVVAEVFREYFGHVNERDYESAWRLLSPSLRATFGSVEQYADDMSTSTMSDVIIEKVRFIDPNKDTAEVNFISKQSAAHGPDGQTCTVWNLLYTLRLDSGWWTIDRAKNLVKPRSC